MSSNNSSIENIVYISFGVIFALTLIIITTWYVAHDEISYFFIHLGWMSVVVLSNVASGLELIQVPESVLYWVVPEQVVNDLDGLRYWILKINHQEMNTSQVYEMGLLAGYCFRLFLIPFFIFSVWWVRRYSKPLRLKRNLNLFDLAELRKHQYPAIKPAIDAKLHRVDSNHGPWRKEASPIRFAILNNLLKVYDIDYRKRLQPTTKIPTFDKKLEGEEGYLVIEDDMVDGISQIHNRCILDTSKLRTIFEKQMGPRFTDIKSWPDYKKALAAVFCSFMHNDKDDAIELLDQLNRSFSPKTDKANYNLDMNGVDELLNTHFNQKDVKALVFQHSYDSTLLPAMLESARTRGRLPPQRFLWLKLIDRTLWYALHQEGGQCAWTEAAGPRAHLLAERDLGRGISFPYIEAAVTAYIAHLDEGEGWLPNKESLAELKLTEKGSK